MYGLIHALYDERQQKSFELLYNESSSGDQLLLRSVLANSLKDCPRILESHGIDWLLCTLASFNKNEEDTMRIFQGVVRKLDRIEFGLLTEDIKFREMNDLADTCLVGLSLFRKRVEYLNRYKAFYSVDYYRRVGKLAFHRLGFERIGNDFDGWTDFIEKEMTFE